MLEEIRVDRQQLWSVFSITQSIHLCFRIVGILSKSWSRNLCSAT